MSEEVSVEVSEQQQMDDLQSNEKKQRSVKLCCSKPCSRNTAGRSPYLQGLETAALGGYCHCGVIWSGMSKI